MLQSNNCDINHNKLKTLLYNFQPNTQKQQIFHPLT